MVIIGYSGSGKSVAIKHIVGLLEPDSGTVFVDGEEVPTLARSDLYALRSHIGYVFQFAALFDSLSIGDNVAMGLRKEGRLSEREIMTRVGEALELVDLPGVETKFPAELSGGMRKRVGIARAIARQPKYILYDEPTTGLDPVTSAIIDQLMIRMREKLRVTSIVITHDMRSAYTVGSRIAMLYEGKCRQVGTANLPCIVVRLEREKARSLVRAAFPRRRWRIVSSRSAEEMEAVFRSTLVDAAIIDLGAPDDDTWKAAAFAGEFPSSPFFGILPMRPSDTPTLARAAGLGFTEMIVDGIDDNAAKDIVTPYAFSTRFRRALADPPPTLGLSTTLQKKTWEVIVGASGRPVTTTELARE